MICVVETTVAEIGILGDVLIPLIVSRFVAWFVDKETGICTSADPC